MVKNHGRMKVCVFCGSSLGNNPRFASFSEDLGKLLANKGHTLVYGGSRKGLMGKVSDACFASGGKVIAIEPRFFLEQGAVTDSITELIPTDTMSERKQKMIDISDCFIALPGGIGTLDEISEVMTDLGLGQAKGKLILINIDGFYNPIIELLNGYIASGFIHEGWAGYPLVRDSLEEVATALEEIGGSVNA